MSNPERLISFSFVALFLFAISNGIACAPLWKAVREGERTSAVENARTYSGRGDCAKTIASLNRATARLDIGSYGKEATTLRMRCYERLERTAAARAHRRLLDDFYSDADPAYPSDDGKSVFRVKSLPKVDFEAPPSAIEIATPEYSEYARRSYITGRVVVSFELSPQETTRSIRVLEMPHPLLASWAIEAVERSTRRKKGKDKEALILPGGHYLATFAFEYRWAKEGLVEEGLNEDY